MDTYTPETDGANDAEVMVMTDRNGYETLVRWYPVTTTPTGYEAWNREGHEWWYQGPVYLVTERLYTVDEYSYGKAGAGDHWHDSRTIRATMDSVGTYREVNDSDAPGGFNRDVMVPIGVLPGTDAFEVYRSGVLRTN